MQIQIITVTQTPTMTKGATPKPYTAIEVVFKNLTFQGKVESKKLTPFGGSEPSYKVLLNAQPNQVFDIATNKNGAYVDWTSATAQDAGFTPPPAQAGQTGGSYSPKAASPAARTSSTYETPEERAKKQVYIVRQSSISAGVAALSVGAKSAPKASDVIEYARELEAYVFGTQASPSGFDDMQDDLPE